MLKTPAMAVVSKIENSVELIFSPGKVQQSCKLEHSHEFSAIQAWCENPQEPLLTQWHDTVAR
jgi:hypothetical protein